MCYFIFSVNERIVAIKQPIMVLSICLLFQDNKAFISERDND